MHQNIITGNNCHQPDIYNSSKSLSFHNDCSLHGVHVQKMWKNSQNGIAVRFKSNAIDVEFCIVQWNSQKKNLTVSLRGSILCISVLFLSASL